MVYAKIFVGPLDFGPHPPDRWGLPTGRVTAAQVAAHPEARLYPGARIVMHGVGAQYYDAFSGGEHAATAETVLLVRATPAQVTSWYMRWLSARGWHHDANQSALGGASTRSSALPATRANPLMWACGTATSKPITDHRRRAGHASTSTTASNRTKRSRSPGNSGTFSTKSSTVLQRRLPVWRRCSSTTSGQRAGRTSTPPRSKVASSCGA